MNGQRGPRDEAYIEAPGPAELHDPLVRREFQKAAIWFGVAIGIGLVVLLAQPILVILGALVITSMLDGGTRLLERILPIGRGWRLGIIILALFGFLTWTVWLTGSQLSAQAAAMQQIIETQIGRISAFASDQGLTATPTDLKSLGNQILGSLGKVTAAVSTVVGAVTSLVMMLVLAIFIAVEPRLYERGIAWMLPMGRRAAFYTTADKMAWTLRRLMAGRMVGMAVEGFGTWILLLLGGVPMAALLGVLTGILAFLPNIGAIISGILIILVGFSAGVDTGLYAVGVYLAVQIIDGYLIVPIVAKRAVDLAPALVLGAQILFGALFGILGLFLADPIVAMIKVFLEERSRQNGAPAQD
ncbi:AI-2E family transporter [Rhizorhapis sp. SPR117]|uniref:AI-2E family transporter n=1 Tax=Rhizorhapis sp. SPR117 TaxID=2912611 RepID=UPI001F3C7EB0|nr:AI-2E family transporter [Rhizorhapis sp. SPR117]